MNEQATGQPLHLSVAAQRELVNTMVGVLRRTGMDVNVADTKDGLTLALAFTEPPEFDGDNFGTDDPDNAALWWDLKDRVERAH